MDVNKIGCYTATEEMKWPLCRSHPQELMPQKAVSGAWSDRTSLAHGLILSLEHQCSQRSVSSQPEIEGNNSVTADSLLLSLYLLFLVQNCNSNQTGIKEVFSDGHVMLMKGSRSSLSRQEPQTLTDIGIWSFSLCQSSKGCFYEWNAA